MHFGVKLGDDTEWEDSHVHDVRFMRRLVFNLWVDNGPVGDPCGLGARGPGTMW